MRPIPHVNRIATAVPEHDVNDFFIDFARAKLGGTPRQLAAFNRMIEKSGIEHRYTSYPPVETGGELSVQLAAGAERVSAIGTAQRMQMYAQRAPQLAQGAITGLDLGSGAADVTHLIMTSCTGFSAPGVDLDLVEACGLSPSIERTIIGFMGCHAAINALKQARHIVRSEPEARVLVVNIELCTLHLNDTTDLGKMLSFCLWGDGCAAALVTAEPEGIALDSFYSTVDHTRRDQMTWTVGDSGFDMVLSGQIPLSIQEGLSAGIAPILAGGAIKDIDLWAVHPGGRSVLDAVERTLHLPDCALQFSRDILRRFGNMSSATVMFVLEGMLRAKRPGQLGCAMAFGPGLTTETMLFHTA